LAFILQELSRDLLLVLSQFSIRYINNFLTKSAIMLSSVYEFLMAVF